MLLARLAIAAALIGASAAAIADIRAIQRDAGPTVDRHYSLQAYDGISVVGPYQIVVRAGGPAVAHARGGSALLDETDIKVVDGTLRIEPRRRDGMRIEWKGDRRARIEVGGGARIQQAAMAGSGSLLIDRAASSRFKGEMAGSGSLAIARLDATSANFSLAGSGRLLASGRAPTLSVSVAGSGHADLRQLASDTADVSVAGSGKVDGQVKNTAAISMVGSGHVALTGGARCSVARHGSGNARCS